MELSPRHKVMDIFMAVSCEQSKSSEGKKYDVFNGLFRNECCYLRSRYFVIDNMCKMYNDAMDSCIDMIAYAMVLVRKLIIYNYDVNEMNFLTVFLGCCIVGQKLINDDTYDVKSFAHVWRWMFGENFKIRSMIAHNRILEDLILHDLGILTSKYASSFVNPNPTMEKKTVDSDKDIQLFLEFRVIAEDILIN